MQEHPSVVIPALIAQMEFAQALFRSGSGARRPLLTRQRTCWAMSRNFTFTCRQARKGQFRYPRRRTSIRTREASIRRTAGPSRHHADALDHQPNQFPPLLEVGLDPKATGIGVQDNALLGGAFH